VPCYAGGIDLDLSVEALLKQADANLAGLIRSSDRTSGSPDGSRFANRDNDPACLEDTHDVVPEGVDGRQGVQFNMAQPKIVCAKNLVCLCQAAGGAFDRLNHRAGSDGGKTNSSPGRARYKPSSHCAGNAGVPRLYLYARVSTCLCHCTRDRGCSKHPAFPAPSLIEGDAAKPRMPMAPRERRSMFRVRQGIRG
jgi:hypothetical protein